MTIASTSSKVIYHGDATTVAFPVPFPFLDDSHIEARLRAPTGEEVIWALGTEYGLAGAGLASGGTLTVITLPFNHTPAVGESLVIRRIVPNVQEIDYPEGGAFPARAHEQGLDLAVMRDQQLDEVLQRTLRFPVSDPAGSTGELPNATGRANSVLGFDAEGNPVAAAVPEGGNVVSTFMATMLDDSDATAARTTLGAASTDAASATAAGLVELSTDAENTTGTDATRAVTPAGLTNFNPAAATVDIAADLAIVRDATDGKLKKMAWPSILAQSPYARIEDQKATTVAGGAASATTWHTRTLNTEVVDAGGIVSIASDQFTLAAGTYYIRASAPGYAINGQQARIRNITGGANALLGQSSFASGGVAVTVRAHVQGVVTIAGTTVFELQHYAQAAHGSGLAPAGNSGEAEIYSVVEIWRLI